jgi:hypothetical protein
MLRRPPAREICWPRLTGPSNRQNYGAVDQAKSYGQKQAGKLDLRSVILYVWQDFLQINPVHDQPKLIFTSGFQPFIRMGSMRRWSRTFMAASPRFQGRWAYVGLQQRIYTERTRMTGVITRQGTTYKYPRFKVSPRAIQLGAGGPD